MYVRVTSRLCVLELNNSSSNVDNNEGEDNNKDDNNNGHEVANPVAGATIDQ